MHTRLRLLLLRNGEWSEWGVAGVEAHDVVRPRSFQSFVSRLRSYVLLHVRAITRVAVCFVSVFRRSRVAGCERALALGLGPL